MKLSLFNKIEFVCGAEVLRLRTRQGGNRNRRSLRSSPLTPSQRTPMLQVYCVGWENDRETKATLHNSAACLAMSFPPSAACKFLDLLPVNLRNLHLHLTKNPFVSRPPHLCGVTLILFPAFACAICLRREFRNSIKKAGARSFKLHAPALRISIIVISCFPRTAL